MSVGDKGIYMSRLSREEEPSCVS